ncbi:unnamed protein product [Caenorhabditis brenneri]
MTDFFKNNPIALRHCILYEFLQGKSPGRAYTNFCQTLGDNLMDRTDFQFYYDQFEQCRCGDEEGAANTDVIKTLRNDQKALRDFWISRLSEGRLDNRPITDMKDVLQSDKYALRACIVYESIRYKRFPRSRQILQNPSFVMYNHFCQVIGDGVMEYREFDFWFYRFWNGEFDLDFERDKDKKVYELSDMPIDVMRIILEKMDVVNRSILAKTSRSLRQFIHESNTKLNLNLIQFSMLTDSARLEIDNTTNVTFMKRENQCVMGYNLNFKVFPEIEPWKMAVDDLISVFANSRINLGYFIVKLRVELSESAIVGEKIFGEMEAFLRKIPDRKLNIKIFSVETRIIHRAIPILSFVKPGSLETIILKSSQNPKEYLSELVEMEQWKQANELEMPETPFDGFFHHLLHFKTFDVGLENISIEIILMIKEILFKSTNFDSCRLHVTDCPNTLDIFSTHFGEHLPELPGLYHYSIPNSEEYFEIDLLRDDGIYMKRSGGE